MGGRFMSKPGHEKDPLQKLAHQASEKAWKQDFLVEVDRAQFLARQHDLVGAMLKNAMEQGEFDNLEGAGKPLNLKDIPYDPDGLHMALKVLKDNGFLPYWMELGKEIDALRAKLNKSVDDFKKYTEMVYSEKRSSGAMQRYEQKKQHFYSQIRELLEEISKKILDFNLHCPVTSLARLNFDVDEVMGKVISDIGQLIEL
jgi:hypothetical protein